MPETAAFPTKFSDTSPSPPYLVTEICSALRSPYPAGDGSAAIFRSMTKAGIAPHRFNDARHTTATLLLDDGANIKHVQALLGHSRVSTTLDVYVHHTPDARDDTAARMDAILG